MAPENHSQSTKALEMANEKTLLPSYTKEGTSINNRHATAGQGKRPRNCKLLASALAGCCVALLWVFGGCFIFGKSVATDISPIASYILVKNAVHAVVAAPTSAVLECFQVYPPVLFPTAGDNTVSSDGLENTNSIATADATRSCQVLLMEHSFGYSYGIPFVGELPSPG